MVDFFKIATRSPKRGVTEIYPKFIIRKSQDLMIRGGDFYAVWLEDKGLWSTDEDDLIDVIDNALTAKHIKILMEIKYSVHTYEMLKVE
jgi:hypothetical protein